MIRLDTYPTEAMAAARGIPTLAQLSCLLHSGTLPPSHHLAVWVGGVRQTATREQQQDVFSWQCAVDVEMEIHLLQQGRTLKAWRGWWKGDTVLVHAGTLALQVFCAGVPQPARALASPARPPLAAQHSNGSASGVGVSSTTAVLEWPALAEAVPLPPPTVLPDEDDLWRKAETRNCTAGTEKEEPPKGDNEREEAVEPRGTAGADPADSTPASASASSPLITAPAGTVIATMRAASVWSNADQEQMHQQLTSLLEAMPARTILVDLRQHPPVPRRSARHPSGRRGPHALGLTKEALRLQYGARYWDRGAALSTSTHKEAGPPSRWSRVMDCPERLEELVNVLARGFSLLLLDSSAPYAESARAVILEALRQRVPNVQPGRCS